MKSLGVKSLTLCLLFFVFPARSAPKDIWLTPERRTALERVRERPYVIAQERLGNDTVVYHWTNSALAVTTQRVTRILGAKARDVRRERMESLLETNALLRVREARATADYAAATNRMASAKKNLDALKKKTPQAATLIDNVIDVLETSK